jgi:hypothetical protein
LKNEAYDEPGMLPREGKKSGKIWGNATEHWQRTQRRLGEIAGVPVQFACQARDSTH